MESEKNFDTTLGKVYQNLRKAKGITQKEGAGFNLSVTQLSAFENGQSILRADKFIAALSNINVTMLEFHAAYNQEVKRTDCLLYSPDLSEAYMTRDVDKLEKILEIIDYHISQNPANKKYKLDKVCVQAVLSLLIPDYPITEQSIDRVKYYLLGVKEWGRYEMMLLETCAPLFDIMTLPMLAHQMIDPLQSSPSIFYNRRIFLQTLINVVTTFIEKDQMPNAKRFLKYLGELETHEYYMYEKLTIVFLQALVDFQDGDLTAVERMKDCKHSLELCGCTQTARMAEEEIRNAETQIKNGLAKS